MGVSLNASYDFILRKIQNKIQETNSGNKKI